MRDLRDPPPIDGYVRPNQAWQCGLADEGPPCPLGPDGHGRCPAAAACRPLREGDRWVCNRSPLRGGPCSEGPGPDGACAVVYRCTPVRSLRTKRGKFVVGVAVAALGAGCMALSGQWRNELLAPGPLSSHHAQLVAENPALGCAKCHAAGSANVAGWRQHTTGEQPLEPSQTTLCLACHKKTIGADVGLAAHSMPLEALQQLAGVGDDPARRPNRDPGEPIACSACHREHQGTAHDLAAVSDQACQACHRQQFHSFADGHPDFGDWPYGGATRIAFNHASHQFNHHPTAKVDFTCSSCHVDDADGQRQLTLGFDAACADCHDKQITASMADGMPLVSLPTLDVDTLRAAGRDVDPWPAQAAGDFDGALPIPAKLLVAADPRGAAALAKLGSEFDFFDVDIDDPEQLAAAADVTVVFKELLADLSDRGQPAIVRRLERLLGRRLALAERESLVGGLSPDVIDAFAAQWFAAAAPIATESEDREMQRQRVSAGGWIRDDVSFSLRRHGIGHADPWMRAWLDALAEAASGPHAVVAEALLESALKPTAVGQCGSCHTLRRDAAEKFTIQWRALRADDKSRHLTRFAHGPHLTDARLSDCKNCHEVAAQPAAENAAAVTPTFSDGDFAPLAKAACAQCHTAAAAGDSCTQCHHYHSGPGSADWAAERASVLEVSQILEAVAGSRR